MTTNEESPGLPTRVFNAADFTSTGNTITTISEPGHVIIHGHINDIFELQINAGGDVIIENDLNPPEQESKKRLFDIDIKAGGKVQLRKGLDRVTVSIQAVNDVEINGPVSDILERNEDANTIHSQNGNILISEDFCGNLRAGGNIEIDGSFTGSITDANDVTVNGTLGYEHISCRGNLTATNAVMMNNAWEPKIEASGHIDIKAVLTARHEVKSGQSITAQTISERSTVIAPKVSCFEIAHGTTVKTGHFNYEKVKPYMSHDTSFMPSLPPLAEPVIMGLEVPQNGIRVVSTPKVTRQALGFHTGQLGEANAGKRQR